MSDGWATVYPRREKRPGTVELFGGPRDGERRVVPDVDTPLVFTSPEGESLVIEPGRLDAFAEVAAGPMWVYKLRDGNTDDPSCTAVVPFDYQRPIPA